MEVKYPIVNMTTPWGDYDKVSGPLELIAVCRDQLKWMMKTDGFRDRAYLEADLRGYDAIIARGSDDIARAFFEAKHKARDERRPFKNNEEVVAHLKSTAIWLATTLM